VPSLYKNGQSRTQGLKLGGFLKKQNERKKKKTSHPGAWILHVPLGKWGSKTWKVPCAVVKKLKVHIYRRLVLSSLSVGSFFRSVHSAAQARTDVSGTQTRLWA
jgi:hypothetical protein